MRSVAAPIQGIGICALVLGAAVLHARVLAPEPYDLLSDQRLGWWTLLALLLTASAFAFGLPTLAGSRLGAAWRGWAASLSAFAGLAMVQTALATPLLPRSSSLIIVLTVPSWSVIAWNLSADVGSWGAARDRVFAVVSTAEDLNNLIKDLTRPERPASVVGYLLVDEAIARPSGRLLVERFEQSGANLLVMDAASHGHTPVVDQAAALHRAGHRIRTLALFYEEWIGKLPHSELARVSLLFDVGELHRRRYVQAKRVVDLAFSVVGLIALIPVVALVSVANPIWNPGSVFFRQKRVGKNGETFTMLKLRTMRVADVTEGSAWTAEGDARVTPLGRWLRRTHLDELPQIINVLGGDLSLVGPRPEQPHYVEALSDKIDFFEIRHIVRPGITGWAQVNQGYVADDDAWFDKLQYDFYYLRRQGIALDGRIIWRTVRGVLAGDGR